MRSLVLTGFLSAASLCAFAQANTAVRPLSLKECIQTTLSQNIELQIVRLEPRKALYNLRGSYGAYDPTFNLVGERSHTESGVTLLGTNVFNGSISDGQSLGSSVEGFLPWGMSYALAASAFDTDRTTAGGLNRISNSGGSAEIGVRQSLLKGLWTDDARLLIRINKLELKRSELEVKREVMRIITELEQAYFDLIYRRETVVVQEKAVELAEQLLAENRKRVEVGAMAPLEAKQAESQAATARADLIAARRDVAIQENLLKGLMNASFNDWMGVSMVPTDRLTAPTPSFDLQESWKSGLSARPDLLQIKLSLEQAGIQLKYDKSQVFPQLDLFATYGYNGSGREFSGTLYDIQERNRPYYSYGAELSIPLGNISARNAHKRSKLTLQQAVLQVKALEQDIIREIDDAIKQAQASFESIAATRAAREYAEDALLAEQKKFEQGRSTTYIVLQTQRDLTAARGEEILALNNYNKNLSQLSFREGRTLERLGIQVETR